ncbi:hypothetical protein IVA79_15130 [Bradyrhizobium sp. 138]|uniref:hypothetical protein n=1 Tax=Bradyrhizobium sp. 138 TaxID=2782615 RepID=UPI001FFB3925|nr:hypothetical protein [Bradyrhizobium sp. 138]MCK1735270.1 hypothetical protein [Bradyrhizobium sp. 138]
MRIIADDRFKRGLLVGLLTRAQQASKHFIQQPELLRAMALIALRTAEEVNQKSASEDGGREIEIAQMQLRTSLLMSPSDSFLWLMLYSINISQNGLSSSDVAYLDQSYTTGPYEGWIALRRNREVLAAFPFLPGVLQKRVISEFSAMVDSDFIDDAALNVMTVGWAFRERLAAGLEQVDLISRERLAKRLATDRVKLRIPGVEIDDRPWR